MGVLLEVWMLKVLVDELGQYEKQGAVTASPSTTHFPRF
jgi:hypothetical protein